MITLTHWWKKSLLGINSVPLWATNIDLLKADTNDHVNVFCNNMTSRFFTPYILQATRPKSKTLIDNILINTVEYPSDSGNLAIQISDHLLQFVILEEFFKELVPKKLNIYERSYQNFNEREFNETLTKLMKVIQIFLWIISINT